MGTIPTNNINIDDVIKKQAQELGKKNEYVENVKQIQDRVNLLNNTYRKRYVEYIKMIGVFITALFCVWGVRSLESQSLIPEYVNNFVIIGILSVSVIIMYLIYQNIQKRDLLNYDELAIQSPDLYDINKLKTESPNSSAATVAPTTASKLSTAPTCMTNMNYCGKDTVYNSGSEQCVGVSIGTTTPIGTGTTTPIGIGTGTGTTTPIGIGTGTGTTTPIGTTPIGTTPIGTTPIGTTPIGTTPIGTTPFGTTPIGTTPIGTTQFGTTPIGTTPIGTTPIGTTPFGTTPIGTTPIRTTPIGTTTPGTSVGGSI